jgi:CheY-like chemotaxis protein
MVTREASSLTCVLNVAYKSAPSLLRVEAHLRILFVEDNAFVREQTVELLEANGREIVACETAEQALAEWDRGAFDVVVTDISLPMMSGLEMAKRVLRDSPHTHVVIASGYALPEPEKLGPHVRVLTKPVEIDQIDAILKSIAAN